MDVTPVNQNQPNFKAKLEIIEVMNKGKEGPCRCGNNPVKKLLENEVKALEELAAQKGTKEDKIIFKINTNTDEYNGGTFCDMGHEESLLEEKQGIKAITSIGGKMKTVNLSRINESIGHCGRIIENTSPYKALSEFLQNLSN